MKKITLLMILTLIMSCFSLLHAQKTIKSVTMGTASLALTESQISKYRVYALEGSAPAAVKLADYYNAVALDYAKALYWFQIASENGDVEAMHSYWVIASQSGDPDDRIRGLFWLKKAASLGRAPRKTLS